MNYAFHLYKMLYIKRLYIYKHCMISLDIVTVISNTTDTLSKDRGKSHIKCILTKGLKTFQQLLALQEIISKLLMY